METKRHDFPFIDSVRGAIRVRHYSYRTEQTYLMWVRRFILFHSSCS
ncbi:phage integrase N-terminal SAM-like domain-containing protein [Endothiovibrio diazotrophicus]